MGYRQIGRTEIADEESETRHLICGSWADSANEGDHPEQGSMRARNIRRLWYPGVAHMGSHMVQTMRQSLRSS